MSSSEALFQLQALSYDLLNKSNGINSSNVSEQLPRITKALLVFSINFLEKLNSKGITRLKSEIDTYISQLRSVLNLNSEVVIRQVDHYIFDLCNDFFQNDEKVKSIKKVLRDETGDTLLECFEENEVIKKVENQHLKFVNFLITKFKNTKQGCDLYEDKIFFVRIIRIYLFCLVIHFRDQKGEFEGKDFSVLYKSFVSKGFPKILYEMEE